MPLSLCAFFMPKMDSGDVLFLRFSHGEKLKYVKENVSFKKDRKGT